MNSFSDTLIYTLIVTLFGMGIVFIVLVLLQYILVAMRIIFYRDDKKQDKTLPAAENTEIKAAEASVNEPDEELIAVITAAVALCMDGRNGFTVKSIKHNTNSTPVWGMTGRMDQMSGRI